MEDWLHSYVDLGLEKIKRGQMFKLFLHDGLIPFIESMGYVIGTPINVLYGRMVCGLYENRNKSTMESEWNTKYYCDYWNEDDKLHYFHVIDPATWAEFWNSWRMIEDFSEESGRGQDRRIDMEHFVWRQLDLENSYQTEVLYGEIIDEEDVEQDEHTKKVDVYLVEAAGWGGLRR
jgi:hypothetical protein